MLGAAASAFYINDAATILPRSIVAKTNAYLAGAAADVLEVEGKESTCPIRYSIGDLKMMFLTCFIFLRSE